jgi:GntR family transcriptional regulator/MocR family aminotransferase
LQASLAEFIDQGHFTTHIRRLRQAYSQRRTLLLAVLEKSLHGQLSKIVVDAGLHFLIRLPAHIDDVELTAHCQSQGLSVRPLSRYYIGSTQARGLVVGFAYVDAKDLVESGQRLGHLIKAALEAAPHSTEKALYETR